MWDTYQAEGIDGFAEFHLYVCAAFLVKWSDYLKELDFQVGLFASFVRENDATDAIFRKR